MAAKKAAPAKRTVAQGARVKDSAEKTPPTKTASTRNVATTKVPAKKSTAKNLIGNKSVARKTSPRRSTKVAPWSDVFGDERFSGPPSPGSPGHVPPGANLSLNIGWDRFEHLLVFVAQAILGLGPVKFRRYGTAGQAQQGIDLAGRRADGTYVVVQCKDYKRFTAASLRAAVKTFVDGDRPFGSTHLIVVVSSNAGTTQIEDELAAQQDAHTDLTIELWGAEQINDVLRERNDIVARFWTRETADTFCTAAPAGGVAAPAPNWLHLSDMVLLEPTGVRDFAERISEADRLVTDDPSAAADILGEVADAVTAEGFQGHAQGIRRRQFDLLTEAGRHADVIELAAELAVASIHQGHEESGRQYVDRIEQAVIAIDQSETNGGAEKATTKAIEAGRRHVALLNAAIAATEHPLGDKDEFATQLRDVPVVEQPAYFPALVLLLAELESGDRIFSLPDALPEPHLVNPGAVEHLDDLLAAAIEHPGAARSNPYDSQLVFRLRLIRARHNDTLHTSLINDARMLKLTRPEASLALASEARRNVDDGSPDDAMLNWRGAIQDAIHEGNTDDASGWLYSVRGVRLRYRHLDLNVNNEHYLAQGLPKTGAGSALTRTVDHETRAFREAADGKGTPAINAARRWLVDSLTLSVWPNENEAVNLLGDLFARNTEVERASLCFQWTNNTKKLEELTKAAGDRALPIRSFRRGPWWVRCAAIDLIALQEDLLDDEIAAQYLRELTDIAAAGRKGELIDPLGNVLLATIKTACSLAGRGTEEDAVALLDLLAPDVARAPNAYRFHDLQHVDACLRIAQEHPQMTNMAFDRLFALAEAGCHDALSALQRRSVQRHLQEQDGNPALVGLTTGERAKFRARIAAMDESGAHQAAVAACALGIRTNTTARRVQEAAERIRTRPAPDPNIFSFGSQVVTDSYLVSMLAPDEAPACVERLMNAAEDRGEASPNRAQALIAVRNLVTDVDEPTRQEVFERSKAFVLGEQDGSHLDDFITNPHPLSTMQVNLGKATLRGEGLILAAAAAESPEERNWVARHAVGAMRDDGTQIAQEAARALRILGSSIESPPDPGILASHPEPMAKFLAIMYAVAEPAKCEYVLEAIANDLDFRARMGVADAIGQTRSAGDPDADKAACKRVLTFLENDQRHSVRTTARYASHVLAGRT